MRGFTRVPISRSNKTLSKLRTTETPTAAAQHPTGDDSQTRLMIAAKCLFAEKGFNGTTVKELADAAHVNISLISYHFGGKEGLFRACLEQIGRARLAQMQNILQPVSSHTELNLRLQLFFEEFFRLHLAEPEVSRIINRECEAGFPMVFDIFKETFFKSFETLVEFIKISQERGFLKKSLDPLISSTAMMGGAFDLVRKDPLNARFYGKTLQDPHYLKEVVSHLLSIYLEGMSPRTIPSNERTSQ